MSKRVKLLPAVTSFYIMEDLLTKESPLKYSRAPENFMNQVSQYHKKFSERLAKNLFDYLVSAASGEARHASHRATVYIEGFFNKTVSCRNDVYNGIRRYNPEQFLPYLVEVFRRLWSSGFGGKGWYQISKAANMYGKVPDKVFIDHAVDLSHNGGLCFDKGIIVELSNNVQYREVLDVKAEGSLLDLRGYSPWVVTPYCYSLIRKAKTLMMVKDINKYTIYKTDDIFATCIDWGSDEFENLELKKSCPSKGMITHEEAIIEEAKTAGSVFPVIGDELEFKSKRGYQLGDPNLYESIVKMLIEKEAKKDEEVNDILRAI